MKQHTIPAATREPIDLDRYGGKAVAIRNRVIIDSDADLGRLIRRIRRKGLIDEVYFLGLPPPGVPWV